MPKLRHANTMPTHANKMDKTGGNPRPNVLYIVEHVSLLLPSRKWNRIYFAGKEARLSEPHLLIEQDNHVITLIMNRPEARNAWSLQMMVQMWEAWQMIDSDPEVRCAILTGAGGTFCAGADLKAWRQSWRENAGP